MAKKLTKKINSQFYPTYFDSIRMLAGGGGIDPVSMLAQQGQQVLSDVGSGMDNYITNQRPDKANLGSAFFSNFLSGGMGVQGAIKGVGALINRKQEFDAQQEAQRQAQLEAIKKQRLGQLGEQQQYAPTFAMGGKINPSEIAKGTKEEMEHTSSKKMSKKIAMEHLNEDPNYYTKLKKAGLADSYARGGMLNSYATGGPINPNYKAIHKGIGTHKEALKNWDNTQLKMDSLLQDAIKQGSGNYSIQSKANIPINPLDTMSNQTLQGYNDWMQQQIDSIQSQPMTPKFNPAVEYNAMGGKLYANGGNLDNTTVFNNGGQHDSNPMGGIPQGPNALVEEGEVRFKDYVFSNRIPYTKKK